MTWESSTLTRTGLHQLNNPVSVKTEHLKYERHEKKGTFGTMRYAAAQASSNCTKQGIGFEDLRVFVSNFFKV